MIIVSSCGDEQIAKSFPTVIRQSIGVNASNLSSFRVFCLPIGNYSAFSLTKTPRVEHNPSTIAISVIDDKTLMIRSNDYPGSRVYSDGMCALNCRGGSGLSLALLIDRIGDGPIGFSRGSPRSSFAS